MKGFSDLNYYTTTLDQTGGDGDNLDIYDKLNLALNVFSEGGRAIEYTQIPYMKAITNLNPKLMNSIQNLSKGLSRIGIVTSITSGLISTYRFSTIEDPTWGNKMELALGLTISGLSIATPPLGIGLSIFEISGGFDSSYGAYDVMEYVYGNRTISLSPDDFPLNLGN